jgi:hypothetical protein
MILAVCQLPLATWHMPHATYLRPPGAWLLKLDKSLDLVYPSIFGRSRDLHGKLLADATL